MRHRMGDLANVHGGEKVLGKQLGGFLAALNLTSPARACKWSDFLGHTSPIYARADLLLTKVHGLEILCCGTRVVDPPEEVDQFASDIPQSIAQMVHIPLILLRLDKSCCAVVNGHFKSGSFAQACNRANCTGASEERCTFVHRLQVSCLPTPEFGGRFSIVVRDFGRFLPPPSLSPGTIVFTNGVFLNPPFRFV
jgi:hypothetical protein